jgi:N-acetylglutamate synthase-like GNAT family acetyltransferase
MLEFTFVYGKNGYELSKELRDNVFGAELTDEYEGQSYHLVGYDKTRQIAAARFTMLTDAVCRIDFVAVSEDYRRQYVGDLAIKAIEDKAKSLGAKEAVADVPTDIMPFFEFEDYEDSGKERERSGKKCVIMRKDLTKVYKCRGCR